MKKIGGRFLQELGGVCKLFMHFPGHQVSDFKAKMHHIQRSPRPPSSAVFKLGSADQMGPRPVAAIQVVQVVRCTRAHDPWGPTSEDQIAIFFKLISSVSHVASHSGY